MTGAQWGATAVFAITYALIATDRVHKTIAALLGAMTVVWFGYIGQAEALGGEQHIGVDWNTIFLLLGLMVVVNTLRTTGVFEYCGYQIVRLTGGRPIRTVLGLVTLTALLSPIVDNVTTVLLIIPVSIAVAQRLDVQIELVVILEVIASNIGGAATLIGDPPNLLIGGYTGHGFMDFIVNVGPAVVLAYLVFLGTAYMLLRRRKWGDEPSQARIEEMDDPRHALKHIKFLQRGLAILALAILGFMFHDQLGVETATISMTAATLLLLLQGRRPGEMLAVVEWPTLFFFIGLFVVVGALVQQGVVALVAGAMLGVTSSVPVLSVLILWGSALASALVDNIPFVATMNPLVGDIATAITGLQGEAAFHSAAVAPLWWSLSLGACLGGNATIIGASANVVGAGIAERHGARISFVRFLRYGVFFTLETLVVAALYIWLRYLI